MNFWAENKPIAVLNYEYLHALFFYSFIGCQYRREPFLTCTVQHIKKNDCNLKLRIAL